MLLTKRLPPAGQAPEARLRLVATTVCALLLVYCTDAAASTVTGTAFDNPLQILRGVFTGPIAYTAALIGIVVAGAMLIFGGEIGEFAKRLIMLILVIAIIVLANNILNQFFSVSGAVIKAP